MSQTPLPDYLLLEWDAMLNSLPEGWEAAAKDKDALQRTRQIHSAGDLLHLNGMEHASARLTLIYATTLSLRATAL